jgi:hypothetical protein
MIVLVTILVFLSLVEGYFSNIFSTAYYHCSIVQCFMKFPYCQCTFTHLKIISKPHVPSIYLIFAVFFNPHCILLLDIHTYSLFEYLFLWLFHWLWLIFFLSIRI